MTQDRSVAADLQKIHGAMEARPRGQRRSACPGFEPKGLPAAAVFGTGWGQPAMRTFTSKIAPCLNVTVKNEGPKPRPDSPGRPIAADLQKFVNRSAANENSSCLPDCS